MNGQRLRPPAWSVAEGPFGVRLFDATIVTLVVVAIEVNVITGGGAGSVPLNVRAYLFGALLALPILFRHRWPLQVLIASAVVMFLYYLFARRNISPAPLFFVPLYDAAVVGYLALAVAIPAVFMVIGIFAVEVSTRQGFASLTADFLSQIVILALAVMLGEVVRGRRALTAETTRRLRLADTERAAEAGRVVAEERLRIARELHDTVAHSMATITVQAGSALHLLGSTGSKVKPLPPNDPASRPQVSPSRPGADADGLRAALTAIRETSKGALIDMRSVLGQLRGSRPDGEGQPPALADGEGQPPALADGKGQPPALADGKGLSRLEALRAAVTAAGAHVTVNVEGNPAPLPAEADHSAYRILQESLTNVLRHAGPGAAAQVRLRYQPEALTITVTNDTPATADRSGASGHGISGMQERAASAGGQLIAAPLPGGGFQVQATLPMAAPSACDAAGLASDAAGLASDAVSREGAS